jgi:hypothetical protein
MKIGELTCSRQNVLPQIVQLRLLTATAFSRCGKARRVGGDMMNDALQ